MSSLGPTICPSCGYPFESGACTRCPGSMRAGIGGPPIRPGPRFAVTDLLHGFLTFFQSAAMLFLRPEYFGRLTLAVLANLAGVAVFGLLVLWGFWSLFETVLTADWGWLEWSRGTSTGVLAFLAALVTSFVLAPVVLELVTSPFLDPLAHQTEVLLGGKSMRPIEIGMWRSISGAVRLAAQVLLIEIAVWIPCLLLSLTVIGGLAALAVTAALNALVWFDIPFARRGLPLAERIRVLRRNWARALGFGIAFQVGALLPVFNLLLLLPTTAVATTVLYLHFSKQPAPAGLHAAADPTVS